MAESLSTGFYEVIRLGGKDAKDTLSEGEKSFITFLYFYHLIRGSFSASGSTVDRVIVFDDPVSSLDSDILFIVASLIKRVIGELRGAGSSIKQVFILTHNIYFHKEISFNKKRAGDSALSDETFWIIRKLSGRSELNSYPDNPIKSSYELLWREVRQKHVSGATVQNVLRRILEHYFKFYGGMVPETVVSAFEGRDRMICESLLSWVNDGSHFAIDDLYATIDAVQVERYLSVFRRIFEASDHLGHYKMMMGNDFVESPILAVEAVVTA